MAPSSPPGVCAGPQDQREAIRLPVENDTLPLGLDFRRAVEAEGRRILATIAEVVDASGKRGDDFAAALDLDPGQLSRALHGRGAHFSVLWLPAVHWRDREHKLIRVEAGMAGMVVSPKPKRSREEENEAVRRYVEERLGDLGSDVLRKALGEDP